MVLNISESGLVVEGAPAAAAGHPGQAFAITLSRSAIEDMIACVQNGGDLQLSLGGIPKFLLDGREIRIPKSPDPSGYDLLRSDSGNPSSASRLPNKTMSIFKPSKAKPKAKAPKLLKATKGAAKGADTAITARTTNTAPVRPGEGPNNLASKTAPKSDLDSNSQGKLDDAIENLKSSLAKAKEGEKKVVVGGLLSSKGGKVQPGKKFLEAQAVASPRPLPPSPALSGTRSPSLAPTGNTAQEKAKQQQQRFPIIHELAIQPQTWHHLRAKWKGDSEEDFSNALNKVADFDDNLRKFVLSKLYWKELDVFEYPYETESDRQKAIDNAIGQYDRMRIPQSDPLWQKLLPESLRGKGICLSKLHMNLGTLPGMSKMAHKAKSDAASVSGGDSEKDDPASSGAKRGKGAEPMSRSSSQNSTGKKKLSPSEAQARRLLSASKKPVAAASTKSTPKVSPAKAGAKTGGSKAGRVLSKEFVSDSSSDDEVPLSTSIAKSKPPVAPTSKPAERGPAKPKAAKPKEAPAPKPKPTSTKPLPKEQDKAKDSIRAEVIARPVVPTTKRPRNAADDDESSSSGAPLSKRVKPAAKPLPSAVKPRTASDASQNSRASSSGDYVPKFRQVSPMKSSPLASSPPTNASDLEQGRSSLLTGPNRDRSASSSSSAESGAPSIPKKRSAMDSSLGNKTKRVRPSQDTIDKAAKFKHFYARYEQLHHEIAGLENPDPDKLTDLLDMRDRLSRMKEEIYASVEA
ncbi:hypothetical protein VTK26DRAFT_2277 [Humicola hyalothermophila]